MLTHFRQFFRNHFLYTGVLQTYCVDHAHGAFRNTRRRVAEARLFGRSFERERAEHIDIVQLCKFVAVSKRTTGGDDGVIQFNPAKVDG